MALRNTQFEYGSVAKWLHWLAALHHHLILKNEVLKRITVGVAQENRLDD